MSLLEDLRNKVRDSNARPQELLIDDDQFDQLADELNQLNSSPFKDIPKITAADIRTHGCWVFGIPVRARRLSP